MAVQFSYGTTGLNGRSKIGLALLGATVVVAGTVLLVVGFTILLGLSVVGAAIAIGATLYRKLTGRSLFGGRSAPLQRMDSSLEVFPPGDEIGVLPPPQRND